jgi:hypothetical protein
MCHAWRVCSCSLWVAEEAAFLCSPLVRSRPVACFCVLRGQVSGTHMCVTHARSPECRLALRHCRGGHGAKRWGCVFCAAHMHSRPGAVLCPDMRRGHACCFWIRGRRSGAFLLVASEMAHALAGRVCYSAAACTACVLNCRVHFHTDPTQAWLLSGFCSGCCLVKG